MSKQIQMSGKLVSVSEKVLTNKNGTQYRVATVNLPGVGNRSGFIYENNFQYGVEVGKEYLCTISLGDNGTDVFIAISHLEGTQRASAADFDFSKAVETEIKKVDLATKK